MAKAEFGIKECSKCEYNLRCQECVYNKTDILKLLAETKADTLRDIQTKFAIRFGTYTPDDVVNITEVFSLLAKIEKEILQ